jgi:type I restriction-modification system DNA methylase subunit
MEVIEIISYYIHEQTRRVEVSFRLVNDSDDEFRADIISLDEAEDFGYNLTQEDFNIFDDDDEYDEFDFDDDFESIDEDLLIDYLNEYYIVNPNKLPKPELF